MKITGLDIGSYSVKMIRIKKTLLGIDIIDHEEVIIPDSNTISRGELTRGIITDIFKRKRIREKEVVVSLPGHLISTRIILLPFKDKEKIAQVIPFELEGLIPFEIEDLIVDSHIISSDEAGSNILVAAIKKETLKEILGLLKEIGIDPKVVSADLFALFNLSKYLLNNKGDTAIVDIGADKTSICIVSNGRLKGARSIMLGGNLITEAIKNKLSLSFDEAQRIKHGSGTGEEIGKEIYEIIRLPVKTILTEIEKTIHTMKGSEQSKISDIYLCGGGAKLKRMKEFVSEQLGIESVEILKPFAPLYRGNKKDFRNRTFRNGLDEAFVPLFGIIIGRILGERGCNINFKRGEFTSAREKKELKGRFIYIGSVVLLLLMAALSNIYIKYQIKEKRYQEVRSKIRTIFKETLPDTRNIVDEVAQLKGATEDLKKKAAILMGNDITTLEILDLLSEEIPKEITIDVFELVIDQNSVRINAETDSFESVDKIRGGLKKAPLFKEVTVSDAKVGPDQKKVRFRITITMSGRI